MLLLGLKIKYSVNFFDIECQKKTYILCILTENMEKKEITLHNDHLKIENVNNFNGFSLIPDNPINISGIELDKINGLVDYIDSNINVLFKKTLKFKQHRPIWFFGGSYEKGKRHISSLTNISKYLLIDTLYIPTIIECDIIVLPNEGEKYINYLKKKCLGNNEYIYVNFEEKVMSPSKFSLRKIKYVYIFIGESNIGKTHIAQSLRDMTIYETNSSEELPEVLYADIVILGNRYIHDIENIISRYRNNTIFIYVEFQKIKN